MSKIIKSQILAQIASQKELIRTAISNVKEIKTGLKGQQEKNNTFGPCPDDYIETHQIRKVLEVLGHSVNLKQAEEILKNFP
jgi:hypothetical protein